MTFSVTYLGAGDEVPCTRRDTAHTSHTLRDIRWNRRRARVAQLLASCARAVRGTDGGCRSIAPYPGVRLEICMPQDDKWPTRKNLQPAWGHAFVPRTETARHVERHRRARQRL